jgi:hypothetical protein
MRAKERRDPKQDQQISKTMKLRGRVEKKLLYAGTKSEHEGLVLVTDDGAFKLQQKGGNPFWDEGLAELEGKEIEAEGILRETRLTMSSWTVLC